MHPRNWLRLLRWRRQQPTGGPSTSGAFVRPTSGGRQVTTLGTRVDHVEDLTRAVLYVTIVTLMGVFVSLGGLMLDQWRSNQETYGESTRKAEAQVSDLQDTINSLNEQVNELNTELAETKKHLSNTAQQ